MDNNSACEKDDERKECPRDLIRPSTDNVIGCVSENVNVPQWGELCKWEPSYQALSILPLFYQSQVTILSVFQNARMTSSR